MESQIETVERATARLEALDEQQAEKPPIGGLRGEWDLYSLDVCPETLQPSGEYYRLTVSDAAVTGGELLDGWFIEWMIKDTGGDVIPFSFPTHASFEPVPIRLTLSPSDEIPAEIIFLGNNRLWLRVPERIV